MTPLTVEEFIQALGGAHVTLSPEAPTKLLRDGEIFVWPSCTADFEDTPGRHVEAIVYTDPNSTGIMVMVSKRVFQALGGVQ